MVTHRPAFSRRFLECGLKKLPHLKLLCLNEVTPHSPTSFFHRYCNCILMLTIISVSRWTRHALLNTCPFAWNKESKPKLPHGISHTIDILHNYTTTSTSTFPRITSIFPYFKPVLSNCHNMNLFPPQLNLFFAFACSCFLCNNLLISLKPNPAYFNLVSVSVVLSH